MIFERAKELCEGKRVLHIGCIGIQTKTLADFYNELDHPKKVFTFPTHRKLSEFNCNLLMGVDIDEVGIEQGKEEGFEMMVLDIEDEKVVNKLRRRFDVILLMHVLEHLANVGSAVRNVKALLRKDNGKVLVSTVNPVSFKWLHQVETEGRAKINPDHVHWFCAQTLTSLFSRYGFEASERITDDLKPELGMVFELG